MFSDFLKYKAFVIRKSNNPDKLAALQSLLDKLGISYGITNNAAKKLTGFNYQTNSISSFATNSGDMIVSVHQPRGTMAAVLFEPRTALSDSMTYDITTWSLPYVYGLEAYATETKIVPQIMEKTVPQSNTAQLGKPYALVAPYESFEDVKFLAACLDKGIHVRSSLGAFNIEGNRFNRGTLIITRADNKHKDNYVDVVRS